MMKQPLEKLSSSVSKPRSRREVPPVKIWTTDEEKEVITQKAQEAGLSLSAYGLAASLNVPIHSRADLGAIKELAKINGDFGRMGGLLKIWLTERNPKTVTGLELEGVMKKCRELQAEMLKIMSKIAK